jgi:hypothetical protein
VLAETLTVQITGHEGDGKVYITELPSTLVVRSLDVLDPWTTISGTFEAEGRATYPRRAPGQRSDAPLREPSPALIDTAARGRIERVADAVAEQEPREHGHGKDGGGEDREVPRRADMGLIQPDHLTP